MRKLVLLFSLVFALSAGATLAKEVQVSVNGMVCGFCAQGIKKHFMSQPAVEGVKVSLESKLVTLSLREGQDLPDAKIGEILKDSGYTVEKIAR